MVFDELAAGVAPDRCRVLATHTVRRSLDALDQRAGNPRTHLAACVSFDPVQYAGEACCACMGVARIPRPSVVRIDKHRMFVVASRHRFGGVSRHPHARYARAAGAQAACKLTLKRQRAEGSHDGLCDE